MTNVDPIRKTRAKTTKADTATPRRQPARAPASPPAPPAARKAKPEAVEATAASTAAVKPKLVRDSFTIPKVEYAVLESLKLRAAKLARPSKKSEVLRAGIHALSAMSDKALLAALNAVPSLKTGRPKAAPAEPKSKASTRK